MLRADSVCDQQRANRLMESGFFAIPPPKDPAVLDEMISAGKMGFIADPAQRTQLLNARYSLQMLETYYGFLREGIDELIPQLNRSTLINGIQPLADNAPLPQELISSHYDFTCIQAEPLMQALMSDWLQRLEGTHKNYIRTTEKFVGIAKQLKALADKKH
ncbi:hypothetical protein [Aliiglaciecola litoralis]|uniref:Uncharacterized protein n=1 Tax=Aliiglaciecola litoralis TaxID=582857 RepID=A0ABN1LDF4_9ALTE